MDEDALKRQVESVADEDPATPIDAPRTRHAARIRRLSRESPQYLALEVELSPRLEGTHRRPGQYVTLAPTGTDPRFLVIASAPTDDASPTWEFLVDVETGLGRALADADRGDELEVSLPEGSGYPVETVADQHVLCFVTGSGIASIRPTIEHWNRHPDAAPSQITLYYGETGPDDYAYRSEIENWNIRTFWCSESDTADSPTEFCYVQDAFDDDDPDLQRATAFVSGAPAMKRAIVARLLRRGLTLDDIVTNL